MARNPPCHISLTPKRNSWLFLHCSSRSKIFIEVKRTDIVWGKISFSIMLGNGFDNMGQIYVEGGNNFPKAIEIIFKVIDWFGRPLIYKPLTSCLAFRIYSLKFQAESQNIFIIFDLDIKPMLQLETEN